MKNTLSSKGAGAILGAAFVFGVLHSSVAFGQMYTTTNSASGFGVQGSGTQSTTVQGPSQPTLRVGTQGEEIKNLQEILKTDPSLYPQGIVSGYFGKLTEEALKRLQQKSNIPVTGTLDNVTRKIIWPDASRIAITVLSPNGGETWNRNEAQTVTWKTSSLSEGAMLEKMTIAPGKTVTQPADGNRFGILPYFRNVTIELVRDSDMAMTNAISKDTSLIAYRLGTADLFAGQATVKVPPTAPEAKDYRVRITVGSSPYILKCGGTADGFGNILCPLNVYPYPASVNDTSDGNLAILGAPQGNESVREQISRLEKLIAELMAQLERLKKSNPQ